MEKKTNINDGKVDKPDFEGLYYQAMNENKLLKESCAVIQFTIDEIFYLRDVLIGELYDANQCLIASNDNENDKVEKMVKSTDAEVLEQQLNKRKDLIESIIKKVNFEK